MADQPEAEPGPKKEELLKAAIDILLFYTTSFFVLLAIFSLFAMIFLVPFFIDPAWSTLRADFDPEPRTCVTTSGLYIEGKSNCHWSSCEEGCTKTVFNCWQIRVNVSDASGSAPFISARLQPNVKGCGYPPRLNCDAFISSHSPNGSSYPCYVSRGLPEHPIAVPELNLSEVKSDLFYCLAIPIPCFLLALGYILGAYFCIYGHEAEKESGKIRDGGSGGCTPAKLNLSRQFLNNNNNETLSEDSKSMLRTTPVMDPRKLNAAKALSPNTLRPTGKKSPIVEDRLRKKK